MRKARGSHSGGSFAHPHRFSPPAHGWLRLSLEADGVRVDIDASYTPNNPIQQLIDALHATTHGDPGRVWWHLETDGYFLCFEPGDECVRLHLDFAPASIPERARRMLAIEGTPNEILLPFWRFLRRFQSGEPHAPHWPDIDYRDMSVIEDHIKRSTHIVIPRPQRNDS